RLSFSCAISQVAIECRLIQVTVSSRLFPLWLRMEVKMNFLGKVVGAALLVLSSPCFAALAAAAEAKIEWEIENRFRYFKRASDFREIAKVYDALKQATPRPTALQLERALEQATIDGKFNGITGGDIRNGWAASIFLHTCGRGPHHDHASCELNNG